MSPFGIHVSLNAQIFCLFFMELFVFLLLSWKSSLYILDTSPSLDNTYYKYFLLVCGLPFFKYSVFQRVKKREGWPRRSKERDSGNGKKGGLQEATEGHQTQIHLLALSQPVSSETLGTNTTEISHMWDLKYDTSGLLYKTETDSQA